MELQNLIVGTLDYFYMFATKKQTVLYTPQKANNFPIY